MHVNGQDDSALPYMNINTVTPPTASSYNQPVIHIVPWDISGVPRGGFGMFKPPPPEIPKALQNRAKLNPIVKTVKNC